MSEQYLDDYLPVIAIDVAVEEKRRIAKMAAATLLKLHNVTRQMKDWRDDSAKLKSNIWRMKMALRADDKNGNDNQQIDPLIVHQRAEISRLEEANDALENEVASLKCALANNEKDVARITVREMVDKIARIENEFSEERKLSRDRIFLRPEKRPTEAEGSETNVALRRLSDKLKEFARGDRTIEMIFANAIGRVVETIVSLSEELVNVSEDLYRFKTKNKNLHLKLDRLRAMLRTRSGNGAEYRKRIGDLNNLAERLMGEMSRLKVTRENARCSIGDSDDGADIPNAVGHIERLMNELKSNLKSDREAMLTAGDPNCLKYMRKVIDLKVNLKVLSVELRQSSASIRRRSREDSQYERYLKTASLLNDLLEEVDSEIGRLKIKPMDKYCRVGGVSVSRYMTEVVELEGIVKKSTAVIAVLRESPLEIANAAERRSSMEELEDLIERLCRKMRDLEVFDDRSSLRERIGRLEASIVRLRLKLTEKDDRMSALSDKCGSVRLTLESDRDRYRRIVARVHAENENLKEDVGKWKLEISELSRKCERFEERVAEMRLMKAEIDAARKKLQDLHDDKETLLGETEKMRNVLRERDKEIESIITRRDTLRGVLRAEIKDLRMKLGIASDENVKLKSIIEGLERREERERADKLKSSGWKSGGQRRDNDERSRDRARNLRDELERLRAESNGSGISLDERIDLKRETPSEPVGDRPRPPENEIADLTSNEEVTSLTYRSSVRTSVGEETSREFERAAANKALESKVKHLENEKEQLRAELSELRSEKGLLDRSMADANNKCAALRDQVNKFKSERNGLREKISEREAAAGNLKFELERARAELEDAAVETESLRSENSRLAGDLDALTSLRSAETEERVRVLVTEKNELTTRINELDDESAGLRDQLNRARAENEYFSTELNKSRVENDKAEARSALLLVTCDNAKSDNEQLRRERDDARTRLDEIGDECRALGDQLAVQRVKYEALRIAAAALHGENNDRKSYLKKIDGRYPLAMNRERGFADGTHNEVRCKLDYTDAEQTSIKLGIGERRDDETEFKAESDTYAGHDNKAKIKDKPKGEPKRPRIEDKALKLELANFRYEKFDVATEPTCVRGEFESPVARTRGINDEAIVGSIPKRFEITNINCREGISDHSGYPDNSNTYEDEERSADIDQLEVENRALKMEVDTLRSSLDFSLLNGEKTMADFGSATEEIQALKLELTSLRDERAALRSRLEMFKEELNGLEAERVALKDELAASRKSNFDLRLRVNDLRSVNEKLQGANAELETRLRGALVEMNRCTATSEGISSKGISRNNIDSASRNNVRKCTFAKENLWTIKKRPNRFECVPAKNARLQSAGENSQHIEGQK